MSTSDLKEKLHIGWREWAELPKLHIPAIKVKIDTGAKTSALHAFNIRVHPSKSKIKPSKISFDIHPLQKNEQVSIRCTAPLLDERVVKSSNGQRENRYVIRSPIRIGEYVWDIDITLTNRDLMTYRMLLGREAMSNLLVEPTHSYVQAKLTKKKLQTIYLPG